MRALGCQAPVVFPHTYMPSYRHMVRAGLPSSYDLRSTGLVAAVKDQGQTGSCEGHSSSGAIETAFALAGMPLRYVPSEIGLYRGAREIARERATPFGADLPPLQDNGAMTEDVLSCMRMYGIRPRGPMASDGRNSDVDEATVNQDDTFGDLEASSMKLLVGPYAIDPNATDAEQLVKSALVSRVPVRVDSFVDTAFEQWTPSQPPVPSPNTSDPSGGGHAIYLVGYTPSGYIIRNSWGTSWGDNGDVLVSPEWIKSAWGLYPWVVQPLRYY